MHDHAENQHLLLAAVLVELRRLGGHRGRLVHNVRPSWKHRLWTLGRPTVVISMGVVSVRHPMRFQPAWASVWKQQGLDKIQECEALEQAGVPIPKWVAVTRDSSPDLARFGDFVVVKPAHGARGALVRVMRTSRVRWEVQEISLHSTTGLRGVSDALLVQEYIHTGPWPVCYRVGTVFCEPIYMVRLVADRARDPIAERPTDTGAFKGRTIVAGSRRSTVDESVPDDVLQLASRVHEIFSTVPLLGTDIIRDHKTCRLYVLEVNAAGSTFHLTSNVYQKLVNEQNIDLRAQFGGATAVARGIHARLLKESRRSAGIVHE